MTTTGVASVQSELLPSTSSTNVSQNPSNSQRIKHAISKGFLYDTWYSEFFAMLFSIVTLAVIAVFPGSTMSNPSLRSPKVSH